MIVVWQELWSRGFHVQYEHSYTRKLIAQSGGAGGEPSRNDELMMVGPREQDWCLFKRHPKPRTKNLTRIFFTSMKRVPVISKTPGLCYSTIETDGLGHRGQSQDSKPCAKWQNNQKCRGTSFPRCRYGVSSSVPPTWVASAELMPQRPAPHLHLTPTPYAPGAREKCQVSCSIQRPRATQASLFPSVLHHQDRGTTVKAQFWF